MKILEIERGDKIKFTSKSGKKKYGYVKRICFWGVIAVADQTGHGVALEKVKFSDIIQSEH